MIIDSEIGLFTRNGNTMGVNQKDVMNCESLGKDVINREHLSLKVGLSW